MVSGLELRERAGNGGRTSVSNEGIILGGVTRDERLGTRVVFLEALVPALPTRTMAGDFRGDFLCNWWTADKICGDATGCGVGGNSASIFSTCHERFSSTSLIRSALYTISVHRSQDVGA